MTQIQNTVHKNDIRPLRVQINEEVQEMKEQKQKTQNTKQNNKNQRFKIKMQITNRNTKYKMPCHVPQAQIKKEVLKDKLQIKNPKHKYDVRQTYQTKPAKPNLPNQIKLKSTKHTEPNLQNQN